jgi:hypothetical protein
MGRKKKSFKGSNEDAEFFDDKFISDTNKKVGGVRQ